MKIWKSTDDIIVTINGGIKSNNREMKHFYVMTL
jgi:hypothetical protein